MNNGVNNLVLVQIVTADCAGILTAIYQSEISIWNVSQLDYFTLKLSVSERELVLLERLTKRHGGELTVLQIGKSKAALRQLFARPVILFGVLLLLLATLFIPTRVFFFRVEGNERIPKKQILEAMQACGVGFGSSVRQIRSESVKNQLLQTLPQLKWTGVNTRGCLAVISVKEREEEEPYNKASIVSSIVAARDGIIESCTVTSGTQICRIGQAVKEGQLLVSGYTDCGMTIRAGHSEAEIYAFTKRNLRIVLPTECSSRGERTQIFQKYSLIFGKKRINFYNDSGISDTSCDKMYRRYTMTLPGGFELPIVLLVERITLYSEELISIQPTEASRVAQNAAKDYLTQNMISGTVAVSAVSERYDSGAYILNGEYRCREMIGRLQNEGNLNYNGENDRKTS